MYDSIKDKIQTEEEESGVNGDFSNALQSIQVGTGDTGGVRDTKGRADAVCGNCDSAFAAFCAVYDDGVVIPAVRIGFCIGFKGECYIFLI